MDEILELILQTVREHCGISVRADELPAQGGVYAELGEGKPEGVYYNHAAIWMIPVLFICKSADQKFCIQALQTICNYLQTLKIYPQMDSAAWLDSAVSVQPHKIGRQEDGQYLYSCIINNKFYF